MANDRTQSAQVKKNSRAEEWLKNAVKDKHVRMIPFSEISKVKYNVAKGGSGTIHLGAWRNMHIAIKEQHNTNDLIKELKMHKQVHDSNYIVKFFGITKHPLTHDTCIVMQFAENGCLQDYLETQNVSITWLTKYRLAWEISSGLDFIHRENIFHTDLHSRNILIDTGGKALITDFGLSKSVNKTIYTTKAGLFGVVPYVAPERMQNPTYTYNAKCDIYSLGVIFWELSSCVIPFEVQLQDVMLAVNIINGVRETTVPGTAVEYEMLYRRCWDGLPQNRPNMDIVLSELVELLAAEQANPRPAAPRPISPRPPRPLSSESMIAPSTPFPYDNDVHNHANTPLQSSPENTTHMRPASPPTQRNGMRQSFAQLAPLAQGIPSVPIRQDRTGARVSFVGDLAPTKDVKSAVGGGPGVPTDQAKANHRHHNNNHHNHPNANQNGPTLIPDSPTVSRDPTAQSTHSATAPSATATAAAAAAATLAEPKKTSPRASPTPGPEKKPSQSPTQAPVATAGGAASGASDNNKPQLLPPLPSFKALALTTPPKDITFVPPVEQNMSVLPETATLALSNGLSMVNVVSKLTSFKNISTISPPPPGAPPPPPVTGQPGTPRVISPPSNRPKVISPPKVRNNQLPPGRASKTISPPTARPPPGTPPTKTAASPGLNPTPKPPTGPPPSPSLGATRPPTEGTWNPVAPIAYVPTTTYSPSPSKSKTAAAAAAAAQEKKNEAKKESDSSAEARPTARPTAMGFPVVTPLDPHVFAKRAPEPTHLPSPASSPSSTTASPAPPTSGSNAPSTVRNSSKIDLQASSHTYKNSRSIDAVKPPSPQHETGHNNNNRVVNNGVSASSITSGARGPQGFFPVVESLRTGISKSPKQNGMEMNVGSTQSASLASSTKTEDNSTASGAKPAQVPFNNFYSLADPYKDLNVDEPSDFFTAVTQGDLETLERILKSYPYLIHDSIGFWPYPTPILMAARSRNALETMKALVRHGAALDRGDQNGTTVLHFVCEHYPNPTEALTFLTKAGADCNSRDQKKRTPLMALLQNTHITSTKVVIESMRILFKFGATTKATDQQYSRTPLHYAINHCREPASVIELLLKKGAEVNAVDWRKNTPLHLVLERMDNEEIVQMLLLYGADPSLKNSNKRNALCVAAENLRVMSAWFLLENDLLSSSPETIKKANELCSKADGPDKNSKPLFKNLLSDWQGKEGKIRRIQLAQDCIMRVQRTPDMKTIDQTQVALEFLESAGVPIYKHSDADGVNGGPNGGFSATHQNNGGGGSIGNGLSVGGSPGLLRLNGLGKNNNNSNINNNGINGHNINNNTHGNINGNNMSNVNIGNSQSHHANPYMTKNGGGHVQVKELRLAEGVEPLKQTMLPVKSVQQLEKEREAIRIQLEYATLSNAF
ncbi:hypothetical protein BGZ94_001043 [Podila epigama]|nr:hypothetical protein BGZ94_001043 [Podila epigama]